MGPSRFFAGFLHSGFVSIQHVVPSSEKGFFERREGSAEEEVKSVVSALQGKFGFGKQEIHLEQFVGHTGSSG